MQDELKFLNASINRGLDLLFNSTILSATNFKKL